VTRERRLTWAAAAAVAVLAVVLLASAPAVIRAMESNGDYVSPLVMGEDAHLYPDARIVLGNFGWWPGLWAVQLLRPLPASEHVAAALPMLVTIAVIALVAWQALRLFGRGAAVALLAVALAAGVAVWVAAASWSAHFTTWWAMAFAGMTAVAWTHNRSRWLLAATGATVLWGAVTLSGDRLAYAAVVAPLVAAATAAAMRRAWRPAVAVAAMAAGTVILGVAGTALAHDLGYFEHSFTVDLMPYGQLGNQAANVFVVLQQLYAGDPESIAGATTSYLGAAVAIGALASVPGLLRGGDLRRTVWTAFWAAAALAPIGAYMISSQSVIGGEGQARYLYGLPLALAALVAIAPRRLLALGAAALLALGTAVNFVTHPPEREPREHGPALANILAAAREHGVTRGYASYFTAYPLTRASRFELRISPVGACMGAPGLCPMYLHRLDGAFVPRRGPSFLLFDASPYAIPDDANWVTREPLGAKPRERIDVGDGVTMLIYDHDIAADLGPLPPL
jgi:hypothetical protein